MTENEAAATPESSNTDPSAAGERPRPRYGELAPEGWSWQPPAPPEQAEPQPAAPAAAAPVAPRRPAPPAPPSMFGAHDLDAPAQKAASLRTDRRLTIILLVLGLFGVWVAISTLNSIPEAMQILHSQQGLADYVASQADMRTILIGNVLQGILWVATAGWAVLRMQHGKRSFWVALIGGAASVVLLFAVVSMVAANDPLLMQLGGGN